MIDKMINIDVSDCMYLDGNYCPNHDTKCDFVDNCYFREYKRKEQECEELQEKYEVLRLKNEEGHEIFAELKHECKEQEDKIKKLRKNLALEIESTDRYRKALEEIEEYTKNFKELDLFEDIKDIINKVKGEGNE